MITAVNFISLNLFLTMRRPLTEEAGFIFFLLSSPKGAFDKKLTITSLKFTIISTTLNVITIIVIVWLK